MADPEQLHRLRAEENLTLEEIGDRLGMTPMGARYHLIKHGVADYAGHPDSPPPQYGRVRETEYPHIKDSAKILYEDTTERDVVVEFGFGTGDAAIANIDEAIDRLKYLRLEAESGRLIQLRMSSNSIPYVEEKHFTE